MRLWWVEFCVGLSVRKEHTQVDAAGEGDADHAQLKSFEESCGARVSKDLLCDLGKRGRRSCSWSGGGGKPGLDHVQRMGGDGCQTACKGPADSRDGRFVRQQAEAAGTDGVLGAFVERELQGGQGDVPAYQRQVSATD